MNFDLTSFFAFLPQFLILLPAALLCYLPVKDMLKYSVSELVIMCAAILVPFAVITDFICLVTGIDINWLLIPSFILFFLFYKHTLNIDLSRALCVFAGVCTLMSFPAHYSYAFDAFLYPYSNAADFSMPAGFFQFGVSCLLAAALALPCFKIYSKLLVKLCYPQVWYLLTAVHCIFFLFNILMIPHSYQTLYAGRALYMFIAVEIIMMLLFLFLHVIFYHLADVILKNAELSEQSRMLELQSMQYNNLQNYMQQTRRLRHDFRQSVHILSALAEEGKLPEITAHLREYEQRLNTDVPVNYCSSAALNALFNYYKSLADSENVKTEWHISLPDCLAASELDLTAIFGNLMENAVSGCLTLPEDRRRFALSVELLQGNCLYIVSTNTFDGQTKKNKDGYVSTKKHGEGIGLRSISSVAEKYDGYANVSNSNGEFFVDVMLKL